MSVNIAVNVKSRYTKKKEENRLSKSKSGYIYRIDTTLRGKHSPLYSPVQETLLKNCEKHHHDAMYVEKGGKIGKLDKVHPEKHCCCIMVIIPVVQGHSFKKGRGKGR